MRNISQLRFVIGQLPSSNCSRKLPLLNRSTFGKRHKSLSSRLRGICFCLFAVGRETLGHSLAVLVIRVEEESKKDRGGSAFQYTGEWHKNRLGYWRRRRTGVPGWCSGRLPCRPRTGCSLPAHSVLHEATLSARGLWPAPAARGVRHTTLSWDF